MLQQECHVVFGEPGKGTLQESKYFDPNAIEIVCLKDSLEIGPISELDVVERIERRKRWFAETIGTNHMDKEYFFRVIEEDIESVKKFNSSYRDYDKVYLWTGFDTSEYLWTAKLLSCVELFEDNIYIANFPNIPLKSIRNETIFPPTLSTTAAHEVGEVFKHFRLLSEGEIYKWKELWNQFKNDDAPLRVLHHYGRISSEEETYVDAVLLSNCRTEFVGAARVIGETIFELEFRVGDSFLNWRLKELASMGMLEYQGVLDEIRHYKVKLPGLE